ncbi:MAG: hypothetical protein Q9214_001767, partial [Letrouitia sp. 1 TL-2023]
LLKGVSLILSGTVYAIALAEVAGLERFCTVPYSRVDGRRLAVLRFRTPNSNRVTITQTSGHLLRLLENERDAVRLIHHRVRFGERIFRAFEDHVLPCLLSLITMAGSVTIQESADSALTTLPTAKRKREYTPDELDSPGGNENCPGINVERFCQLLKDIIQVLRIYDTIPSLLNFPIDSCVTKLHASKRTKIGEPTQQSTISSLVESDSYESIEAITQDVEQATIGVISEVKLKTHGQDGESELQDYSLEAKPDVASVYALRDTFQSIMRREIMQRPDLLRSLRKDQREALDNSPVGGNHVSKSEINNVNGMNHRRPQVLTLFGGSGQPKQLFSSLQENVTPKINLLPLKKNNILGAIKANGKLSVPAKPANEPLTNQGLPNGISLTKIIPVHGIVPRDEKDVPTLGERFAPPAGVPPLNPPRQSRHTATRSSSVNWYNPSEAVTPNQPSRRESYTLQPLSTGQWLTYNIAPSPNQLSTPEAKRKQRNRTLSFGELANEPSEEAQMLYQKEKEDALFRTVYSSFAPDRDNAGALVSEHLKNRIWWNRVGQSRLHVSKLRAESEDEEVMDSLTEQEGGQSPVKAGEEMSLEEAVELWTPEDLPSEMKAGPDGEPSADTSEEVNEILKDISELLETLNSYQRIRNLSLASNARTSPGQNPQLSAMTGTPTSPSSDELNVYNILKSQLTTMIATLPPYAIAKLDGDQLGALNVSTNIQMSTKNYKGSLEEDEISTKAKQSALGTSAAYPPRAANVGAGVPSRSSYGSNTPIQQSHRTGYGSQTMPARSTTNSSHLPNQQYSRPPSSNHYFTGNARSSFPAQRSTSTSTPDRYPYTPSQHYGNQTNRSSYANGYSQYSTQSTTTYGAGYANSHTPRASLTYSQPSRTSQSYNYSATLSGRSASPPKTTNTHVTQGYPNHNSTSSQLRPPLHHQQSSHFNGQSPASPQVNGTAAGSGLDGQQSYGNVNGQAGVMNSHKGQIEQSSTPVRQSSGTPQPTSNGNGTPSRNGTPVLQQNGA